MEGVLQKFEHLRIQPEEITAATNNFDDQNNYIGRGGFGRVYKGQLVSEGRKMVAIKRLDRRLGQGEAEFLKEIDTLSRYRHENLISLLGFCYQVGEEAILVYEYASRGSLDRHLNSPHLTWSQRLNLCIGAAKGLRHLHDPKETHQRLIHCDVKTGNILLDDDWNAKLADFGFSIMGPANEPQSTVINLAGGTRGYIDPLYLMTNTLTKESDVYSFGVVLFEVLCGELCCKYTRNGVLDKNLVPTWIKSYEQNKLNDFIFKSPTVQPMGQGALEIFSNIAYRCLKEARDDRPTMAEVVMVLETALESHKFSEGKPLLGYEEMIKTAEPPLSYGSEVELMELLYKGVLLNGGKTFFSLNKKGEHCEMISIAECLGSEFKSSSGCEHEAIFATRTYHLCRFATGTYYSDTGKFKTCVRSQFLSPGITYTVNLVFQFVYSFSSASEEILSLKYKLQGETETSVSHLAYTRDDGQWMCELYQFTCDQRFVHLQILFEGLCSSIAVEGIEFRPLEKVEHVDQKQHISYSDSDSDENWEEKLPTDYDEIMKWSKNSDQWTTNKEAWSIFRKGFLIGVGKKRSIWFSLDKKGKKCHMLSATTDGLFDEHGRFISLPESRFGEVIQCDSESIEFTIRVQSKLLSSETRYAISLVYKFPKDQSEFEAPVIRVHAVYLIPGCSVSPYIYLVTPQTPVIRPTAGQNTHNPLNKPKIKGIPQLRTDGWMEVQIWEFQATTATTETIDMHLELETCDAEKLTGIIIEGFEFRPV